MFDSKWFNNIRFEAAIEYHGDLSIMKPVDVVVLTKNSERLLKECVEAVYKYVPVNRLIIVDGYSTDKTFQIVNEFQEKYRNVVFTQDRGTRGEARQKAIEMIETDWFMFVDSDVILSKDWFAKAEKLIKDDVGAIWGIEIWSVLMKMRIINLFLRLTMKIFHGRGGTHDLLVRRKAVEGIKIPHYLHTYEDAYIRSWIIKQGYKVLGVYDPYCIHYRPNTVWTFSQNIGFIISDIKYALRNPALILSYGFYAAIVAHQILLHKYKTKNVQNKTRKP
ncbi:glycosyltransferase family 2 protein [Candidatus Bathyarchaeota archaeon]|nr:glycosyltransferase family 2 protein [Candidatus Bathyarchaeota archaeon]